MRCLLTVSYDGTNYGGFQLQKNADTVAGRLNAALTAVFGERIRVKGASRTDAGVHAIGQRALFSVADGLFNIPEGKLPRVINGFLPEDVAVSKAEVIDDEGFNAVTGAKRKTYIYRVYSGETPDPLVRLYAAREPRELDIALMRAAAEAFVGRHDFAACMAAGGKVKTTVREIYSLEVERACFWGSNFLGNGLCNIIQIKITGNGFLYNMARIIAGTLIEAGTGKIAAESVAGRLASRERDRMGRTAQAKGLALLSIEYA